MFAVVSSVLFYPACTPAPPAGRSSLRRVWWLWILICLSCWGWAVSDGALAAGDSFLLRVNAVNEPPTISEFTDQTTSVGVSVGPLAFAVDDAETAPSGLIVSGSSSNPALVPNENLLFEGSDASRTLTVTPAPGQSGTVTITVSVTDGVDATSTSFQLIVSAYSMASGPGFALATHSSTDGAGPEFNQSVLPINVSGSNPLLIAAWHSEFDSDQPDDWVVEYAGVPGTLLVDTNGYSGGDGNRRFRIYYWAAPTPGLNNLLVSNPIDIANELSVAAILLTNTAPLNPIGDVAVDVSTSLRTGESEAVDATTNDLVVHVIADRLLTRGTLGPGEASRVVANDGFHPEDGDASLWISTKPGAELVTTVSSSNWSSSILNGVAIVVHGPGPGPTISNLADQQTPINTATPPIPFSIADADTPFSSLTLSATSSNPILIPDEGIVFGGSGADRTITLTPALGVSGMSTIVVTVSDGEHAASASFVLSVNPEQVNFTNSAAITIPSVGDATPYPSIINVTGLAGVVATVTVTLQGFSHTYPGDVDILLVGPNGQNVLLFSDLGEDGDINNVNLTFSDAAPSFLSATEQISSGTYKPSNDDPEGDRDTFPTPAPVGPYGSLLSVFDGQTPNGTWALYVVDDGPGDEGTITRWALTITLLPQEPQGPTISDIPDQATTVNTSPLVVPFSIADSDTPLASLTLSGSSSNPTLVPNANLAFGGAGSNRTLTITPAAAQSGTTTITVSVSDGAQAASDPFVLTVSPPASLTILSFDSVGRALLRIEGQTGRDYVVEASEDLSTWLPLGTVHLEAGNELFQDPAPTAPLQRFYRLQTGN